MSDRWIGLNELADETGMSVRNLQYIRAQEPGVLVTRQRGSLTQYKQPDCAINLRKREAEKARREAAPLVTLDEARTRKAVAEAELAELEIEKARGEVVTVAEAAAVTAKLLTDLRAGLVPFPRTAAPKLIGAKTVIEMEQRLDAEIRRLMGVLSSSDFTVDDIPDGVKSE